jgi:hypothetical protein
MKLPWNVVILILHALTAPGPSAFMALAPLLGLAGGMLASLRKIFP